MSTPLDLLRYFNAHLEKDLMLLKRLVEMESFSQDKNGIDLLADFLAREFALFGAKAEILPLTGSGNALRVVWPGTGSGKPVLLLGHLDTVWPAGTVRERPFMLKDGKAYGPGILDMKSGILLCLLICRALHEQLLSSDREVIFFFMPDEEIGSGSGLPLLEPIAKTCGAVLCLEPPLSGGKAKTFRKGVGAFRLRIAGIAAHAGVEPEKGASAILEMSHQIVKLHKMTSRERGISVSVGIVEGGSAGNVVPSHAGAEIDFRFATVAEGRRLEKRIRKLRPKDPRCSFEIKGGINRPPLERTPAVADLFLIAKTLAAQVGMDLGEGETGGGSDGSFTAALGIPTLDGLGVEGDGAHAVHEHILVSDVPRRAALIGLLAQEVMK
jgi:glutamate carboxypeptidase